jgi:hypothetical protein
MPLKVGTPLTKKHELKESDPTGDTFVSFRQATTQDHIERGDLFSEASRVYKNEFSTDIVEVRQNIPVLKVWRKEAFLTMIDCNILGENGEPLFQFSPNGAGTPLLAMTEGQFEDAWGKLPFEVSAEIHSKLLITNPAWASTGE